MKPLQAKNNIVAMYCYVVLSIQVICNCGILFLVHVCNYATVHGSSLLAMLYISYAMLQCSNIQPIKLNVMLMRKLAHHFVPSWHDHYVAIVCHF